MSKAALKMPKKAIAPKLVVSVPSIAAAKPVSGKPVLALASSRGIPDRSAPDRSAMKAAVRTSTQKAFATAKVVKVTPAVAEKADKKESLDFKCGDFVVYPAHGVGRVEGIETHNLPGMEPITLYAIHFDKDRMILKVPVSKAKASGLRRLSSRDRLKESLETLQGRARIRRVMWSRRAQEYEAKIKSGDPVSIAEVVRDLYRNDTQQEQSYSERQIYQAALERLAREVAAVEKIDEIKAAAKLESVLAKAA